MIKVRETLADALHPIVEVADRNAAKRRQHPDSWWDRKIDSIDDNHLYKPALYESPIEDAFAYKIVKHLSSEARLVPQHAMHTRWGRFRADFLVMRCTSRVCIECDGRDFHDRVRDEWRDVLILGSGNADTIYRFSGSAIAHSLDDCLFVLSVLEPELFDDRGRVNLRALSSDSAREHDWSHEVSRAHDEGRFLEWNTWVEVHEDDPQGWEDDDGRFYRCSDPCARRAATSFHAPARPDACRYFDFANKIGPQPLDELIAEYERRAL